MLGFVLICQTSNYCVLSTSICSNFLHFIQTSNNHLPIFSNKKTVKLSLEAETFGWRCQCFNLITLLPQWGLKYSGSVCALNSWFPTYD